MFPRIVKSNKKSKTYEYLVISESFHVPGKGSTTRNIANLGNLKKINTESIQNLIDGLIRIFSLEKYALAEGIEILQSLEYGSIILWRKLWQQLNLQKTIRRFIRRKHRRLEFDAEKLIEMMVVNRCVDPLSKLGTTRWVERTCYTVMEEYHDLPTDVAYFYRSMDYLLEIKDELEREIFEKLKNLFSINVKLTFYDITSSYFYTNNCPIGYKGHSRDNRPEREQIVIGVVTSYEGYPIKHYVFDGNTKDETTVIEVVNQLKRDFHIEETIFVGDRGMITKLNLEEIQSEGFGYIMGIKHRQDKLCKMLFAGSKLDHSRFEDYKGLKTQEYLLKVKDFLVWKCREVLRENEIQIDLNTFSSVEQQIRTLNNDDEIHYGDWKTIFQELTGKANVIRKLIAVIRSAQADFETEHRLVICLNEDRKITAKEKRDDRLTKLSKELKTLLSNSEDNNAVEIERRFEKIFEGYKRRYRKFFAVTREGDEQRIVGCALDLIARLEEEKRDGIFILKTSCQQLETEKIIDAYKNLQEVELLFDDLKNFVDLRPIRHTLTKRVRAHVFICMLAMLLKRIFEIDCMGSKSTMHDLEEISKSKFIKYKVKFSEKEDRAMVVPKITNITDAQAKIFQKVGVKNPTNLEGFVW